MKPINKFLFSLIAGIFIILCSVIAPKIWGFIEANLYASFIILGASTFLILFYTASVAKDERTLSQDAADYAYYLGFSLTIIALVSVFMTDGVAYYLKAGKPNAAATGIQTLLLQFGAGLAATMVGVVARIYLIDKLTTTNTPIDESVRELRYVIGDLVLALESETSTFTTAINSSVNELNISIDGVRKVSDRLAKSMEKSSRSLEEAIDFTQLDVDVKLINEKIKITHTRISTIGDDLAQGITTLSTSLTMFNKNIVNSADTTNIFNNALEASQKHLVNLNPQIEKINASALRIENNLDSLPEKFFKSNTALDFYQQKLEQSLEAATSVTTQINAIGKAVDALTQNTTSYINETSNSSNALSEQIKSLNINLSELTKNTAIASTSIHSLATAASSKS